MIWNHKNTNKILLMIMSRTQPKRLPSPTGPSLSSPGLGNDSGKKQLKKVNTDGMINKNENIEAISPHTNEERLLSLLNRIKALDETDHSRRAALMNSVTLFVSKDEPIMSSKIVSMLFDILTEVFSTAPPFSVITRSYRSVFFHPKEHYEDVAIGYKILHILTDQHSIFPQELLKALMRRLTSASNEDRIGAKNALMLIDISQAPLMIHLLALTLTPPPPHGICDLLDLAVHILSKYKAPPPLFDDFFITTSFDDVQNVLSINSVISEARLNDGITIFEELWCTFRILHFAPHYQTFFDPFMKALCALHEKNEDFAHQCRRFLLNHWPRLDPQKAVLFMKEATAICSHGPPVEEFVWQRLSWRSSSIQWQIAMEGLSFIQQTVERTKDFDHSVLIFLLNDAIKSHWHSGVKTKATAVLALLPETNPLPPKTFQNEKWNQMKEYAHSNYPEAGFIKPKRKTKQ